MVVADIINQHHASFYVGQCQLNHANSPKLTSLNHPNANKLVDVYICFQYPFA
jgi:hypothetical protein